MSIADIISLERLPPPATSNSINEKKYSVSSTALYGCISGENSNQALLSSMFQLRHRVFNQRLKWDVTSINEKEVDNFDNINTHYIITTDINNNVKGCVRLLPTTMPYMLSEVFPTLWQSSAPLPCSDNICELSRFSFEKSNDSGGYGFSNPVIRLLRNLVMYARQNDISHYIFVTTSAIERLLMIQGISIKRVGHAIKIGNASTVVIFMNINTQTEEALFHHLT